MKQKIKYLIFSFVALSLILFSLPQPALAGLPIVSDILQGSEHALGGVEEMAGPISEEFIDVGFRYIKTLLYLTISAHLLDWIMSAPIEIYDSPLVKAGWKFTMGLANLIFIFGIMAIAFAHIFKTETFKIKQTLPRLIIAILLVNFSLLFIAILVDIAAFFQQTILPDGSPSLATQSVTAITGGIKGGIIKLVGIVAGKAAASMIPVIGPGAQLAMVGGLAVFGFPFIMGCILQILVGQIMTIIFAIYFVLFALRIYVIQILAIFAPIAFACWAFPFEQTQNVWKYWLKALIGWIFLGMVALFLLVLGLNLVITIMPGGGPDVIPIYGWIQLDQYFAFYFTFLVFAGASLYATLKLAPAGADTVVEMALKRGMPALQQTVRKGTIFGKKLKREGMSAISRGEGIRRRAERLAATPPMGKGESGWGGKAKRGVSRALPIREIKQATGKRTLGFIETERKNISESQKKAEGKTAESNLATLRSATNMLPEKIGALRAAIEKGQIKEMRKMGFANEEIQGIGREALITHPSEFKTIRDAFPHLAKEMGKGLSAELQEKAGITLSKDDKEKKGYTSVTEKLIAEINPDKIKSLDSDILKSKEGKTAIQRFWGGAHLSKAAQEMGGGFVNDYMKTAKEIYAKDETWHARNNRNALVYLSGNSAQDAGFESVSGKEKKEVQEDIKKIKPNIRPEEIPSGVVISSTSPPSIDQPPKTKTSSKGRRAGGVKGGTLGGRKV